LKAGAHATQPTVFSKGVVPRNISEAWVPRHRDCCSSLARSWWWHDWINYVRDEGHCVIVKLEALTKL